MPSVATTWQAAPVGAETGLLVCRWGRAAAAAGPTLVVPDGCVDLVWSRGRLLVAGPDLEPFVAGGEPGTPVAGVRLRPWIGSALLRTDLDALRGRRVAAEDVLGPAAAGLARRLEGLDDREAAGLLAEFAVVRARSPGGAGLDRMVAGVGGALLSCGGKAQVEELAREAGASARHLRRRFVRAVGYGPKAYARVVRFQRALALLRAPGASAAGVAFEAGYADQSHLTRELVALGGRTPAAVMAGTSKTPGIASRA